MEIFIGELFPLVRARFDSDDVYEALLLLAAKGLIRRDDSEGDTVIALIEPTERRGERHTPER